MDSDFVSFVQHAGVPSVDIYYGRGSVLNTLHPLMENLLFRFRDLKSVLFTFFIILFILCVLHIIGSLVILLKSVGVLIFILIILDLVI